MQPLKAQSLLPIAAQEEMRGIGCTAAAALDSAVTRLRRVPTYATMFGNALGGAAPISAASIGTVLACFGRTLPATDSPFDRYQRGDLTALSVQQVQGLQAFVAPGGPRGPGDGIANSHVSTARRDPLFPGRVTDLQAISAFWQSLNAASYDRSVPSSLPVGGYIQ